MRSLLIAFSLLMSTPALADVTHQIDARFGVGYQSDPNAPQGTLQPLYEGRLTTAFTERMDNGVWFRFELGVVVGNIDSRQDSARLFPRGTVGFELD